VTGAPAIVIARVARLRQAEYFDLHAVKAHVRERAYHLAGPPRSSPPKQHKLEWPLAGLCEHGWPQFDELAGWKRFAVFPSDQAFLRNIHRLSPISTSAGTEQFLRFLAFRPSIAFGCPRRCRFHTHKRGLLKKGHFGMPSQGFVGECFESPQSLTP